MHRIEILTTVPREPLETQVTVMQITTKTTTSTPIVTMIDTGAITKTGIMAETPKGDMAAEGAEAAEVDEAEVEAVVI